jgi:hypothetical protein
MSWGVRGWPGVGWLLGRLKIDGGTVNRSLPVLRLKQRWANAAQAFTAASIEVEDNGSLQPQSRFIDLIRNGVSGLGVGVAQTGQPVLTVTDTGFGPTLTFRFVTGNGFSSNALGIWNNSGNAIIFGTSTTAGKSPATTWMALAAGAGLSTNSFGIGAVAQNGPDVVLERDAADILAQRRGTNGQTARWSRTHTDANNYERVELDCSTNTFRFGPRALGTGTARVLYLETGSTTVANLASAATVGTGARAFVTDATASTFASVVAGGGSNRVPVYSDGTDWRIG